MERAKYSTWIRKKRIIIFGILFLVLGAIALLRIHWIVRIVFAIAALLFLYTFVVLVRTYYLFSAGGGDYQAKIHDLIVRNITIDSGKLLDIGSGSGSLIIKAAKAFPEIKLTGIDYWGDDWEYSKKLCEENARIEGVDDRIRFIKASASKLPFEDDEFGVLISCLTFHEVKDEADKTKVLNEALRVLKKDGEFVFMDLFLDKTKFGELESLISNLGVSNVEVAKLDEKITLPDILLSKQCLGNAAIIKGKK